MVKTHEHDYGFHYKIGLRYTVCCNFKLYLDGYVKGWRARAKVAIAFKMHMLFMVLVFEYVHQTCPSTFY